MSDPLRPEKSRVRAAFEASASRYDEVAVLQREVADRLLERLALFRIAPRRILDLGSGTGYCSRALADHYRKAQLVSLDLAQPMVEQSRARFSRWERFRRGHRFVTGDAERLPFADASFDLIFSSLTLQWCADLEQTFRELRRVVRPGGVILFSTLGPDTLKELRASWAAVDSAVHVNEFIDMHHIGDVMLHTRFADPVMDMERLTLTYRDPLELMRELKVLGAHNVNPGRSSGMTGPRRLRAVCAAYEQFRQDGVVPATYELLYGHAWRPETEPAVQRPGEFSISPESLKGSGHG